MLTFWQRDAFSFEIVRVPFICINNVPSNIFYGTIFSEIIRIVRCTMRFEELTPRLVSLSKRMKKQGPSRCYICRQISSGIKWPSPAICNKFDTNKENKRIEKQYRDTLRYTKSSTAKCLHFFRWYLWRDSIFQIYLYKGKD